MSGHSKWSTIKRKKGAADSKRGALFSKLIKEITVAAREGGGDIDSNMRLKTVVDKAKHNNMPADNIDRAIKRGIGTDMASEQWEQINYEGYGPGGVAILVETLTDNRNRTAADIRHIFTRSGGKLGGSGSVAFKFERKGFIQVGKDDFTEEQIFEKAIEAGANDVDDGGDMWDIYTGYTDFNAVKISLEKAGISLANSELYMEPNTTVKVAGKEAQQVLKMIEMLEDNDDVQNAWANFDIDESDLDAYEG
jgi:YebC/PmpR family DNA-binding regulatory protein